MLKGKNIEGKVKVFTDRKQLPISDKATNTVGIRSKSDEELEVFGYFDIVYQELGENQRHESLSKISQNWFNASTKKYVVPVIDIPQKTAQELYDKLIAEGKSVFDEFRRLLNEAASPYNILGNHPQTLKDLTQTMLDAKSRILNELDTHLANNDLDKLKSFTYQTQESEQLKSAIENFK